MTTTRSRRRIALVGLFAVIGPGLLAGLSDDDPAGITTYSVLGARTGYELLWVITLSTLALIAFHGLGARMGVVTGQGLIGIVRDRYGVRAAAAALGALVLANIGTTCAEFAGIAAGAELFGVPRWISVSIAAVGVSALVLRGSFRHVEHVLIALASVFIAYIAAGLLAHPDWSATLHGLTIPSMSFDRDSVVLVTATVGTTLAPWGLAFIQSYAVDKRLTVADLRFERIDVGIGAVLTGVVGVFVAIACAATLHAQGLPIDSASDAARALEPLAGDLAGTLFALGLIGAAVLAASILPLSTAYSVSEFVGTESALDDRWSDARPFYATLVVVTIIGAGIVLLPGAPLITILVATQVLNAVLLVPLLVFMVGVGRDQHLMGEFRISRTMTSIYVAVIGLVSACVVALAATSLLG